jgi:hypothetical protein
MIINRPPVGKSQAAADAQDAPRRTAATPTTEKLKPTRCLAREMRTFSGGGCATMPRSGGDVV